MGYSVYYSGEIEIAPPLTEEHAEIVLDFSNHRRTEKTAPIFAAVAASAEPDLPGYSGLFELSEERDLILPDEFESSHGLRLWLRAPDRAFPRSFGLRTQWRGFLDRR